MGAKEVEAHIKYVYETSRGWELASSQNHSQGKYFVVEKVCVLCDVGEHPTKACPVVVPTISSCTVPYIFE